MAQQKTEDQSPTQGSDNPDSGQQPGEKKRKTKGRRKGGRKKLSKMEAVRRTLAKLGTDAKPKEIQLHLKKTYKISDMSTDHISTYKGEILRKAARELAASAGDAPLAQPEPPARTRKAAALSQGDNGLGAGTWTSEDILAARELLKRVGGADQAHALIELCK